ncbi:MAG: type II secretion system F family protein [Abditibacteriales bacterium]|nr:type II secretion system F family protein [Abditibacteriales bacterium]MDW8367123.1 type II secretion system F family protein [Abditibacteriales bacterium]
MVFGLAALIFLPVVVARSRRTIADRIEQITSTPDRLAAATAAPSLLIPYRRRDFLSAFTDLLKGKPIFARTEKRLTAAGLALRPTEFLAIVTFSTVGFLLIGCWAMASVGISWLLVAAITAFGYYLPNLILNMLIKRRKRTLEMQLADALTMIASALKGGYGFVQALTMAGNQLPPPIADEFQRVTRLIELGVDTPHALERMGARVQSYDFDMTITATCIQLESGGNLSQLLETIAWTIRERIKLRREISAATAQGRMSGAILVLLPIGILGALSIINPEYLSFLISREIGHKLLYGAAFMQSIGAYIIWKMLQFEG